MLSAQNYPDITVAEGPGRTDLRGLLPWDGGCGGGCEPRLGEREGEGRAAIWEGADGQQRGRADGRQREDGGQRKVRAQGGAVGGIRGAAAGIGSGAGYTGQ